MQPANFADGGGNSMQPANFADGGVANVEFPEATFCSKKFHSARPLEGPVLFTVAMWMRPRAFLIASGCGSIIT
jgi:hypothetical protein